MEKEFVSFMKEKWIFFFFHKEEIDIFIEEEINFSCEGNNELRSWRENQNFVHRKETSSLINNRCVSFMITISISFIAKKQNFFRNKKNLDFILELELNFVTTLELNFVTK